MVMNPLIQASWVFILLLNPLSSPITEEMAGIHVSDTRTIEIRYHAPDAGEVFLIWGIDGWQTVPQAMYPAGTEIKNNVMHTRMERQGDFFIASIEVPAKAQLDFGFLITRLANGSEVSVWDEPDDRSSLTPAAGKEMIEVQGNAALYKWRLKLSDVLLPFVYGIGIILLIYVVLSRIRPEKKSFAVLILLSIILIYGLGVRIHGASVWNSYRPDSSERLIGDEPGYNNMARELLQGYGFTWPGRVPLYPLWLSGVYALTGGSYNAVPYAQAILGTLTIFLTYLLGSKIFDQKTGLVAAGWAGISYVLIHQGFHYLSEILYTPIILMVASTLWKAWQHRTALNFLHAGFWVGVSNLVRPTLLLFPIFVLIILLIMQKNRQALTNGIILITASFLTVSPWIVHNYFKYGAIFPLQTSNAILWQGSPEYYHLIRDQGYTYMQIWQEVLYPPGWEQNDPNSIEGDRYWTQRALKSIAAEPLIYLKYTGEKLFTFWIGDPNADWNNTYPFNYNALIQSNFLPGDAVKVMMTRILPLIALTATIFLSHMIKGLIPFYLILIYFNLIHALTHAEARLSDPLHPFLLIIVAGAAIPLIAQLNIRERKFLFTAVQAEGD